MMKVLSFANGVYQGHVDQDNQLNGLGVFIWKNSQTYYGQWQLNQMAGRGIIVFPQGGYLYGHFKNNLLEGKSKLVFPNQDAMFVYCSQGFFQGKAIRKFKDSSQYIECLYDKGNMISINSKLTKDQFKHKKKLEFDELINMKEFFEHLNKSDQNSQTVTKLNEDYDIYDKFNNQMKCLLINDEEIYFGSSKFNFPRGYGVKLHLKSNLIQRGRFLDGLLDGRGRKNFLNGDIYDGGFTEGQISNSGLFYDNTNFNSYRGFFEYNKLVTLFAIFQTKFPSSQYDYEKQQNQDLDCNIELQSECIFFTQKEALFMINSLHTLGKKYVLSTNSTEDIIVNNELIELQQLKNSLQQQQQVHFLDLKTFQQDETIEKTLTEKNQSKNFSEQNQNEKVDLDAKQKAVNKKSAKSLLPPLSRKASLLDGQKGNANTVLSTSMLNSTQPFSSQYNSNTSSNTTFIQQNQGEFSNTDKNSQQSSYFSKFRSTQEVNQEDNSNIAHSQSLVKKVSFCDQIKKMNTQTNKATNIQNSFLEQMQIDTINEMKKNDKNNNLNKSKEELILLYDSKDQQKPQQNNDYESNNYHLLSLNDNRSEMQKQNIDNQSVIFEKSIEIYDSNENLQEISAQNEFENSYFESNIKNLQMPNLEQQDFNQIINQDQQNLNQNSYLEISPQKEQKQQKENLNSSSPKLGSSEFSLNNNNQNENSCQYQHQLEDNNCQSMKKSIQKSQYTQNDEKQEFDKKEISNFLNNSFQMNQIYNQNNEQQEEEESIKKQSQIQFKGQANLDYCYNSNQSIDYMTKSVQFYDSEENSIQNNRSDFVENNQNGLQQNITFEQYFQILSQKQNIQQENGQLTLTFSKNNDSTNQCIDLKNHRGTFNKNEQSQKSICQNFLVGIPQDCVHSHYDIQEQKQVRNDFSAKLKQIVQHKQLQFHNQKQQSQTEKIDQKTIVSENQIIDSNITTDPSYSYQQFKLQNQNQQQKMLTSNITNENRFSFCNNASFNDNLHLQNQSQKSYYYNNIEQEDQIKQIQGRKINQQELNNDFENKENNSLKNKFDKTQQNQKAKSQQQKVKIVQIDLLKELSQNNLKFDQDFQEKDNVYVPQIFYNENSQYRHQDHNQLSQNLQQDNNQKQSNKNVNKACFYKSNHRKQNSEIFQNAYIEVQYHQKNENKINSLNHKLQRKQSTSSLNVSHSNQIQKMVSSKSQTLLKQMSSGDLHTKNNCEESSTKILKQISSKQFQGQKAIFQKLIEFKYVNKLAQLH